MREHWFTVLMLGGVLSLGIISLPVGRMLWRNYLGIEELQKRVDALELKWVPDK